MAIIGFASSADACEKCPKDQWGVYRCDSGHSSGWQACWGGGSSTCTKIDTCGSGGGGLEPEYPDAVAPCLNCDQDMPSQGFVLRSEVTPEVSPELSPRE